MFSASLNKKIELLKKQYDISIIKGEKTYYKSDNVLLKKNIEELFKCYNHYCSKYIIYNMDIKYNLTLKKGKGLIEKYQQKIISKPIFLSKYLKLWSNFYNSNEYKEFSKCIISKCYNEARNKIKTILKLINIKYQNKNYDMNDYINIMSNYTKFFMKKNLN